METSLRRVLRLAGADITEPMAIGEVDKDGGAHHHLMRECGWYAQVESGENATDPKGCKPATGKGGPPRLVVKFTTPAVLVLGHDAVALTPRTPEASTVVQPTVPKGGPGLFHIKGEHLPPYVEHLYKHLVGRYGKHKAYGVAIGVVKKWAKGVNPGGWKTKSGKGKRTHPDVQAAAAKNVAQWETSIAKTHGRHHG